MAKDKNVDYYEVYVNNKRLGKSISREDAYGYIKENYNKTLPYLEYRTLGIGDVDIWENPITKIEIRKQKNTKVNILEIINNHINKNNNNTYEEKVKKEVNVSKVMPCTPKRTRIKNKEDKLEEGAEGKIIEKDGKKYISKKDKKGNFKWEIYREVKYHQRKSPVEPAKNFKEGIVKKGLDDNNWKVIKTTKGIKKWIKK